MAKPTPTPSVLPLLVRILELMADERSKKLDTIIKQQKVVTDGIKMLLEDHSQPDKLKEFTQLLTASATSLEASVEANTP